MTFEEATTKLHHLYGIRSAISGLIQTAQAVYDVDPAFLAAIYDADDKAGLVELLDKTQAAIDEIRAMTVT